MSKRTFRETVMACVVTFIGIGLALWCIPKLKSTPPASVARATMTTLPREQTVASNYLNDVIGNRDVITIDDVAILTEAVAASDDIVVRRWGLAVIGDRLNKAQMTDTIRTDLEELVMFSLRQEGEWRLRRAGIACIDGTPLIRRSDFAAVVSKMRTGDPQQEVRDRAKIARID